MTSIARNNARNQEVDMVKVFLIFSQFYRFSVVVYKVPVCTGAYMILFLNAKIQLFIDKTNN